MRNKNLQKNNLKNKNGYAILETLLYISFFAILSIAVINAMVSMMKSFKENRIQSELIEGSYLMEKISREIRQSSDIVSLNLNELILKKIDSANSEIYVKFLLNNNNIQFFENNVLIGNLNSANLKVNDLSFFGINTIKGKALKFSLNVQVSFDVLNRDRDFYNSVILRGSY